MSAVIHDDASAALPQFGVGRRIKQTRSLCPRCLQDIDAEVFERDGAVWMDKRCADHGVFSALLATDPAHYYLADPKVEDLGSCCGPSRHCGDQVENHSCNLLIEITQRCNLTCPTCYAGSSPKRTEQMSLARFEAVIDQLLEDGKGDADLIQLSGGEPTIHPQMFEMITLALAKGVRRVYVNTNGIRLAQRSFAERLAAIEGVSVYLQFDGFSRKALTVLRGDGDLLSTKMAALDHCEALGIDVVPVMTLTRGVNDGDLGALLREAASRRSIHKVMIQPAMYSGRYEGPRLVQRLTVADVVKLIAEQTGGTFSEADFGPIPCSDPNCFSMALALKTAKGLVPVSRYFPRYETWSEPGIAEMVASVTDSFDRAAQLRAMVQWVTQSGALAALDDVAIDALLDQITDVGTGSNDDWAGLLAIGIKPFMDAYTLDRDRTDKCCNHIVGSDGKPVSFCEYNAKHRPLGIG
ncbi:MAG: radical SAM protein [Nannocystaceae bacterium]|nr:radical SAM protein [Nannocystaceae bacterium]